MDKTLGCSTVHQLKVKSETEFAFVLKDSSELNIVSRRRNTMYCPTCGTEIQENAQFCFKCGKKTGIPQIIKKSSAAPIVTTSHELNRDAQKVYLTNLRALECIYSKLSSDINCLDNDIKNCKIVYGASKKEVNKPSSNLVVFVGYFLYALFYMIIVAVGGWLIDIPVHWLSGSHIVRNIGIIIALCIFIGYTVWCIYSSIDENKNYKKEVEATEKQYRIDLNSANQINAKNKSCLPGLISKREKMYAELCKVVQLRDKAYAINIIPSKFRKNIYAIYYLHEYITTSNESLTSAFLHLDLDDLKIKLDQVLANQRQIIINQQIQIAQNEQLQIANEKKFRHLASIEENTERAAQYAQIAANNAEACAWIGMANYIR